MDFNKTRPGGLEKTTTTISLAATLAPRGIDPVVVDFDAVMDVHKPVAYEPVLLDTPLTMESILPEDIEG